MKVGWTKDTVILEWPKLTVAFGLREHGLAERRAWGRLGTLPGGGRCWLYAIGRVFLYVMRTLHPIGGEEL
jgi:hypothetical protein